MALKDLLVHLDAAPRATARLELAAALASRHSAHLAAVYPVELPSPALFYGDPGGFIDARLIDDMYRKMRENAAAEAGPVEQHFRDRLRRDAIEGEWRMVEGSAAETVAVHARYADLAIVGQPDPQDTSLTSAAQIPVVTLLSSGRPVLVLPYVGSFPTVGQRVLIGWKSSSREATRALNDALPLLRAAQSVTVLAINPDTGLANGGAPPAADITLHLARHGVTAEAAHTVARDVPEGEVLLNYADDLGADLIVAGGYGHSRMREFAFGGVTRTLLSSMTVPVLLSH
jgi:nucleotide-binding universal stress UspA family protein